MSCSSCNVILLLHRIDKKSTKIPLPLYGLVQCHEDTPRVFFFLPVMRRADFTCLHHGCQSCRGLTVSSQQRNSLRTTTLYSRKIPRSSLHCIAMCEQKIATRLFRSFRCRGPRQSHLINLISLAAYPIPSRLRDLLGIVGRSCLTQRYSEIKRSCSFIILSYFFCIVCVSGRLRRHIPRVMEIYQFLYLSLATHNSCCAVFTLLDIKVLNMENSVSRIGFKIRLEKQWHCGILHVLW